MKDEKRIDRDIVLMGDFNIDSYDSELYEAISRHGLRAPEALVQSAFGSNLAANKRYDQILHHPVQTGSIFSNRGGVVDFYQNDHTALPPYKEIGKDKFTYQLSDHLPLWIQLNIDTEQEELDQLLAKKST